MKTRSYNALQAEKAGRKPMSRAIPMVRWLVRRMGGECTVLEARQALEATYDGEWHHVGRFASKVEYYNTAKAAARILGNNKKEDEQHFENCLNQLIMELSNNVQV